MATAPPTPALVEAADATRLAAEHREAWAGLLEQRDRAIRAALEQHCLDDVAAATGLSKSMVFRIGDNRRSSTEPAFG